MAYHLPAADEIRRIGESLGLSLGEAEASAYHGFISALSPVFRMVEQLPADGAPVRYPRVPGYRPEGEENRYNAWTCKTTIKGAASGKLTGKKVAIKDSVCVAGVPLSSGASILEGYVPDIDATVVTRILDAGGEIVGKTATEYLCFAGNSATSATGPVQNPAAPGRTTGGSSNGSAAVLAAGEVDLAIGADQAGSIRMPASFCGVVGLKPTYGLVPYTGVLSIEYSFDHVGPMARNVADCALLLDVIAGSDGIDGRQGAGLTRHDYVGALDRGIAGMRIGLVREGLGRPESEEGTDRTVRSAATRLAEQGAIVEEISIPWHTIGAALWLPIGTEGPYANMMYGHGVGIGHNGDYPLSFMRAFEAWRSHANELPPTIKTVLLMGAVLERHGGRLYARAMNQRRRLRAEYDAALAKYDVLVMPTTPMTALEIPPADAGPVEVLSASWGMLGNTSPFDLSGHPAISVPCGTFEDRPVGFMIVGRHFDEPNVFRLAQHIERHVVRAG